VSPKHKTGRSLSNERARAADNAAVDAALEARLLVTAMSPGEAAWREAVAKAEAAQELSKTARALNREAGLLADKLTVTSHRLLRVWKAAKAAEGKAP